jgi:hypothetical protein
LSWSVAGGAGAEIEVVAAEQECDGQHAADNKTNNQEVEAHGLFAARDASVRRGSGSGLERLVTRALALGLFEGFVDETHERGERGFAEGRES